MTTVLLENTVVTQSFLRYEKKSSDLLETSLGLANLSSKPWKGQFLQL